MKKLFSSDRYEIKIALVYFIFSVCWIFFSDRILITLVSDRALQLQLQTYKGWGFVIVTTIILYMFIRRDALKLRTSRKRIKQLLEKEKNLREQAENEKKRTEEILLEAPSAICILEGPEHRFTYANKEYRKLVGERDLVGLTPKEALPELEGQGFFKLIDKVYETAELHKGSEVPFIIHEGERERKYYRNYIYKPLLDNEGDCTGIFVEAIDVTEQVKTRKRLEKSNEEKQILLRELHHRVKNNLALIISLIELEADEYRGQVEFVPLKTIQNRIFAIAEIYELLVQQENLKDIPFHKFMGRLQDIIYRGKEQNDYPNLDLRIDKLTLNINQAVPAGLMINEILSRVRNGNGQPACEDIQLSVTVEKQNKVRIKFHIRKFREEVREKIINAEKYIPAMLIQALTKQLAATLDHSCEDNIDLIKIQFQKKYKRGAASNI